MKNNFFKTIIIPRFITALLVAAPLSLTVISAICYLGFNVTDLSSQILTSYVISALALLAWALATFLAAFYKEKAAAMFFALIWWICFLAYVSFFAFGAENIFTDSFFGTLTLIFSLPAWSYLSLVEAFVITNFYLQAIISLVPAFIIAAVNTVIAIKLHFSEKKEAEDEINV